MCSVDVLLNSIFVTLVQHRHLGFSIRFNQRSFFAGNQSSDMDHMVLSLADRDGVLFLLQRVDLEASSTWGGPVASWRRQSCGAARWWQPGPLAQVWALWVPYGPWRVFSHGFSSCFNQDYDMSHSVKLFSMVVGYVLFHLVLC
jgi:hypothetical protein